MKFSRTFGGRWLLLVLALCLTSLLTGVTSTEPSASPSSSPSASPSSSPSASPSSKPSASPSSNPSASPSSKPSASPSSKPSANPSSKPSASPSSKPSASPSSKPSGSPSDSPSGSPSSPPTDETGVPTKSPSEAPTDVPSESPTKAPTDAPSVEPTTGPTNSPSKGPTSEPTKSQQPSSKPSPKPTYEFTKTSISVAVTPETTKNKNIETAYVESAIAILSARRRELRELTTGEITRLLQDGLPNGCFVANQGTSDALCKETSKGKFSYKCDEDSYVCCKKKQGLNFNSGAVAGKCKRNNVKEDPVFNPEVNAIDAKAKRITCVDEGIEVEQGNKCVLVTLTMFGDDLDDLLFFEQEIENAIEDGTFNTELLSNSVPAVVLLAQGSESPSQSPTTNSPTAQPTIYVDPCPDLAQNCTSCLSNTDCLWCEGDGVCFNQDPDKRASTIGNEVSRFLRSMRYLQPENETCTGNVTASADTCASLTERPTAAPTAAPTSKPTTSSSVMAKSTNWNFLVSGVFSAILVYLA